MNDLDLFSDPNGQDGRPAERPGRRAQRTVRKRQRKRRRSGSAAFLFAMAFLVAIVGTGGVLGFAWLDQRMNPPDYSGAGAGNVTVQVKTGATGSSIASTLQKHDVVKSVRAFLKVYAKENKASTIQPGFYQMRLRMSSKAAMAHLLDPKARAGSQLIISEGLRTSEIFAKLSEKTGISVKEFQAASRNTRALGLPSYAKTPQGALNPAEGYLYPGRYDVDPKSTPTQILKQMVSRFKEVTDEIDLEGEARKAKMNPATVVTMASLIQAEGGKDSDFPKISRVILNRVNVGMPLQFDTAIVYFLNKRTLDVRERDYKTPHPYNTYLNKGLTPGPISSPSVEAIKAALNPADGDWRYFVATDPTRKITEFAETDVEFRRLEAKFRAWQKANPGN